jgi:hypothetical protein
MWAFCDRTVEHFEVLTDSPYMLKLSPNMVSNRVIGLLFVHHNDGDSERDTFRMLTNECPGMVPRALHLKRYPDETPRFRANVYGHVDTGTIESLSGLSDLVNPRVLIPQRTCEGDETRLGIFPSYDTGITLFHGESP